MQLSRRITMKIYGKITVSGRTSKVNKSVGFTALLKYSVVDNLRLL